MIYLYDRKTCSTVTENIFEKEIMHFLYESKIGIILTKLLFKRKLFSIIYGLYMRSNFSKNNIARFIKEHQIDISEVEDNVDSMSNFNEFFTRKLKATARPIERKNYILIAPADSRLTVYDINTNLVIPVKGKSFSIKDLLKNSDLADRFNTGKCLIFRLAPSDYHRFCYMDNAIQEPVKQINGVLHSVSPLAAKQKLSIFDGNYREYCVLKTENFDEVVEIDVGALVVGKIVQNKPQGGLVSKGEEKGLFEFGGSTIILLLKNNKVQIDQDIETSSKNGIETIVRLGERIGIKI